MPRTEPAPAAAETRRLTATEIFDAATENARSELRRPCRGLAFSGLAGGMTMELTAIAVAAVRSFLGDGGWQQLVAYMVYPSGFIAVIIGRQQLFTENTLYPVVLVLDERKHLLSTLRLWGVVFGSNIAGALIFAALAIYTPAVKPEISVRLVELGSEAVVGSFAHLFWRSGGRLAHCAGHVDGDGEPLDHRAGRSDLAADVYRGDWKVRALHCDQ